MQFNDEQLIADFRLGKEKAFEEIWRKYHLHILKICLRCVRNREDAKDITITVFGKFFILLPPVKDEREMVSYLATGVINRSKNKISLELRRKEIIENHVVIETEEGHINNSLEYDFDLALMDLPAAIKTLPRRAGSAVHMFYYEKKSEAQVAQEMEIRHDTVRNLKVQGIKNLRKKIKKKNYLI